VLNCTACRMTLPSDVCLPRAAAEMNGKRSDLTGPLLGACALTAAGRLLICGPRHPSSLEIMWTSVNWRQVP
jgi:hypothetical protein